MTLTPFTMPKIRPVPIETKGLGFWASLKVWLLTTRKWKLLEDYVIYVSGYGNIFIPVGFIFDGASIPKLLRALVSPSGVLFIPGLIHDFGYAKNLFLVITEDGRVITSRYNNQKFWDDLFLKVAKHVNGMAWLDNAAWASLRAFGFISWNKYREKEKTQ